ncbi:MAG: CHAT domain-containing protein [Bacteroidetes bacterium]|nr:CHAT domain-containing protein [Bacteroidota bacterium]MBU1719843.1 CHAT domain-containing protein [Bacteroidota bacterium]
MKAKSDMKNNTVFHFIFFLSIIFNTSLFSQSWKQYDSLRLVFTEKQSFDTALVYARKALEASLIESGVPDTNCLKLAISLGETYYYNGDYLKSATTFEQYIPVAQKIKNAEPFSSVLYNNAGLLFDGLGNFPKAEKYYMQGLSIDRVLYGEHTPGYAISLNNLGILYANMGRFDKAIENFSVSQKIYEETRGMENQEYIVSLNCMALACRSTGDYTRSEIIFLKADSLTHKIAGEKTTNYAALIDNTAGLYEEMGNFQKADSLYHKSLELWKEIRGDDHPDYAAALNNLGGMYESCGNLHDAEKYYLMALQIWKKKTGERHLNYASTLSNIAVLHYRQMKFDTALTEFSKVLEIRKELLGEQHPAYCLAQNNLANVFLATGDYDKAEPLLKSAYENMSTGRRQEHIDFAFVRQNLARLYHATDNDSLAEMEVLKNDNMLMQMISRNFDYLSEAEKEKYLATIRSYLDFFFAFALERLKVNPALSTEIYSVWTSTRGILLSNTQNIRNALLNSSDSSIVKRTTEWLSLKEWICKLQAMSAGRLKEMGINLDSLQSEALVIEKELSLNSSRFTDEVKKKTDWEEIRNVLSDNEVAVEILEVYPFNAFNNFSSGDPEYYALVFNKTSDFPQVVRLCSKQDVLPLLAANENSTIPEYISEKGKSNELWEMVWKPLTSYIGENATVFLSPAGVLHRVSFVTLFDNNNIPIIQTCHIHYLSNTVQIVSEKNNRAGEKQNPESGIAVLFGGVAYNMTSEELIKSSCIARNDTLFQQFRSEESSILDGNNTWAFLEGTQKEVTEISHQFEKMNWQPLVFSGQMANETTFKSLLGKNSPRILHIATHGFFCPEPDSAVWASSPNRFTGSRNPLMRSGLVLAGGNRAWSGMPPLPGTDDGILTAEEISNTFLGNTDLVVLSACETGLGDIRRGEGVYGLQRAFLVAGAKSVIMSLWQVPDSETTELMELFYENWLSGKTKYDAFHDAQSELSKKYDPFFWAAFVLVE